MLEHQFCLLEFNMKLNPYSNLFQKNTKPIFLSCPLFFLSVSVAQGAKSAQTPWTPSPGRPCPTTLQPSASLQLSVAHRHFPQRLNGGRAPHIILKPRPDLKPQPSSSLTEPARAAYLWTCTPRAPLLPIYPAPPPQHHLFSKSTSTRGHPRARTLGLSRRCWFVWQPPPVRCDAAREVHVEVREPVVPFVCIPVPCISCESSPEFVAPPPSAYLSWAPLLSPWPLQEQVSIALH
jgi:hypothetical protein